MSSKIKVDTIENVAGSGNVSLGSGHNLVVPGNITGQGTAAITSNATVGGTLAVTGIGTFTDDIVIGDGKTIGSASDVDAIDISSGGIVNFTQTPTLVAKRLTNTPSFEAYLSGDVSLNDLTNTKVPFNTEVFDSDGKYDNSSNYRFTPTIAGKYFVFANVGVKESTFTIQQHNVQLALNGSDYRTVQMYVQPSEVAIHSNYISAIMDLDGDDYVEIFTTVRMSGSASPFISDDSKVTYFGAYKLAGL